VTFYKFYQSYTSFNIPYAGMKNKIIVLWCPKPAESAPEAV
jgi:hypothetical protein